MTNHHNLSLKRIAAKEAFRQGRIDFQKYNQIIEEVEKAEKALVSSEKELTEETKSKIFEAFSAV